MDRREKRIRGYCVLALGCALAPFLPFLFLPVFPVIAVIHAAPLAAVLFSLFLDSLLLPSGAPLWGSLTFCTVLFILLHAYIRRITTL